MNDINETEEVAEEGTEVPAEPVADTETYNETAPVDDTTVENVDQENGTPTETDILAPVDDSLNTWVDDTYQTIGGNYQSLIGYYQMLIDQYFGQTGSEQTNDDSENVNVDLSEVSADAAAVDTTTEEVDSTIEVTEDIATTVDNTEVEGENNSAVSTDNQVDLGNTGSLEVQADAEQEGNLNAEQPELAVDEVASDDETELVNQNEQDLNQQDEVEKDPTNDPSVKDKLIGYYQDVVSSFSNFMSFLK